jgi:hypothetical protein
LFHALAPVLERPCSSTNWSTSSLGTRVKDRWCEAVTLHQLYHISSASGAENRAVEARCNSASKGLWAASRLLAWTNPRSAGRFTDGKYLLRFDGRAEQGDVAALNGFSALTLSLTLSVAPISYKALHGETAILDLLDLSFLTVYS